MKYGQLIGALTITTLGRSAAPPRRGMPTRRHGGLASRTGAVCTALAIAVTLAVAVGLASSAVAAPPPHVANAATADQPPKGSGGPTLSGLREADEPLKKFGGPHLSGLREAPDAAAAPSEEGGFPWGTAAIGSGVALGLFGLAMSRGRTRKRTGPAALSQ